MTLSASVFILAFSVLFVSIKSSVGAPISFAASRLKYSPSQEVTPTPQMEYFMAYPGVLPDNPIYKIKMIRDRVWLWLTTDSVKKVELLSLYADKRMGAGKVLIEGNKLPLGVSTLVKGEKYLEQAIWELEKVKAKGIDVSALAEKLARSALKYQEIITVVKERVSGEGVFLLNDLVDRLTNLQKKAQDL